MKKKLILMCIAGALVMTAVIGGTLAGFNTSTENKAVTNITVNELGIDLTSGSSKEIDKGTIEGIAIVPGGEVEIAQNIINDVEGGYELYTRVTIGKKWENDKLDASKIHVYAGVGEDKSELVAGTQVNDWIVWYSDEEQIIMYYTKPLNAGEASKNLIDAVGFDADMDNAYAGAKVVIEFSADAVQTIAAEDSIPSEWGVYPVIEADKTISAIEE